MTVYMKRHSDYDNDGILINYQSTRELHTLLKKAVTELRHEPGNRILTNELEDTAKHIDQVMPKKKPITQKEQERFDQQLADAETAHNAWKARQQEKKANQ